MADVLTSNLVDKTVMSADGRELGTLYQITLNLKTGELADLIVEPKSHTAEFDVDDEGRYRISVDRVQAVRDYIMVE